MEQEKQLTQTQILERGWTLGLIKKHLPEPTLKTNPIYKSARPMKLWPESVVSKTEQSDEFKADAEATAKRKNTAKKAVKTKTDKLDDTMSRFLKTLTVKQLPEDQLRKETLAAKQEWYEYVAMTRNYDYEPGNAYDADENTVVRWEVNYVRHNLVSYDKGLDKMFGKTGAKAIYTKFRCQILDMIADMYPFLKDECERQKTPWYE